MRKVIILLSLTGLLFVISHPVRAASRTQVVDVEITHVFGKEINVKATLKTDIPINSLQIIIQSQDGTIVAADTIVPAVNGSINYTLDLIEHPIRAFSHITTWFEINLEDGTSVSTQTTNILYDDNRFNWQNLQSNQFNVFWYQDDPSLGQKIIDTALEGRERILSLVDVPAPEGILIYAYPNVADMQETLMFSGGSSYWIAGHAASDLGVIIVSLPPGPDQILEIKRQIPHELVHILLYRQMGPGYANLPRWLNEGLATSAELYPNPDYQVLLDKAYEHQALIPIRDLCASFPMDAANFQVSYAESYDFTGYLLQTYGKGKIQELILSYTRGMDCEQGIKDTYQVALERLEADWREARFNENRMLNLWLDNLPLLLVFGAAFITPMSLMIISVSRCSRKSEAR